MDKLTSIYKYLSSYEKLSKRRIEQLAKEEMIDEMLIKCKKSTQLEYYKMMRKHNRERSTVGYSADLTEAPEVAIQTLDLTDKIQEMMLTGSCVCENVWILKDFLQK